MNEFNPLIIYILLILALTEITIILSYCLKIYEKLCEDEDDIDD